MFREPQKNRSPIDQAIAEMEDFNYHSQIAIYPHGTRMLEQGARPQSVFLLLSGMVRLIYSSPAIMERTVGIYQRGGLLGGASAITLALEVTSVESITDCRLLHYTAQRFRELVKADHQFARTAGLLVSYQASFHLKQLIERVCLSARQRLELFLNELSPRRVSEGLQVTPALKHRQIAYLMGMTPEHLSRLLKTMKNEGTLRREHGWLVLNEPSTGSLPTREGKSTDAY